MLQLKVDCIKNSKTIFASECIFQILQSLRASLIPACKLNPTGPSQTEGLLLEGAHGYSPTLFIRLVQDIGLESEVAKHLAQTYGDRAFSVAKQAALTGKRWPVVGKRIHSEFPYIDAEVRVREPYRCVV